MPARALEINKKEDKSLTKRHSRAGQDSLALVKASTREMSALASVSGVSSHSLHHQHSFQRMPRAKDKGENDDGARAGPGVGWASRGSNARGGLDVGLLLVDLRDVRLHRPAPLLQPPDFCQRRFVGSVESL